MSATTKPLLFSPFKLSPHGRWGGIGAIVEATKLADELGFYSINMPEHIILPQDPAAPPLEDVWYDNFVVASHLGAVTTRIRFLLYAMIIPYHEPMVAAKQLATLDQVTEGRVICGTGVGWLKGELEALGVPHEKRGAITDEYLEAMRELWTQDTASYDGRYVNFAGMSFNPKMRADAAHPAVDRRHGPRGPAQVCRVRGRLDADDRSPRRPRAGGRRHQGDADRGRPRPRRVQLLLQPRRRRARLLYAPRPRPRSTWPIAPPARRPATIPGSPRPSSMGSSKCGKPGSITSTSG